MKLRTSLYMILLGIGGTLLYQEVKNGNLRKLVRNMNAKKTKMLEDIENML